MNRKNISLWIIFISIFSLTFWYSLVFAWSLGEIKFKLSSNLFVDSIKLNQSKIIINSRTDLSDMTVSWDCWVKGKLSDVNEDVYVFDISTLETSCEKSKIIVNFNKGDLRLTTYFIPIDSYDLYSDFLDFSDEKLESRLKSIDNWMEELSYYESYNRDSWDDYFEFLKNNRKIEELKYMRNFISDILKKRTTSYVIPLLGWELTDKATKLPNSWRPYRDSYTDWVHHGWDFDANYWDTVVSLDYWVVVRVVNDFSDYDYSRIDYSTNSSDLVKLQNLDILRWNQVWVKTMKWDVAFYSHLSNIFDNIEVWTILSKWQPIWSVWASGVPDDSYSDFHLHIPIQKNPYSKSWNYTFDDYMWWDWYFKGETTSYIVENQSNLFE